MVRKCNGIGVLIIVLLIGGILSYLSFSRSFLTYATETDFLGGFLPEAQRVFAGEPLQLSFHPPFYSIILAGVHTIIENWFHAGIVISLISCLVVLTTNFYLLEKCCGRYAGWAVLAAFAVSTPFLTYSCFATSDIFFLSLYSSCLLLAYYAYTNDSRVVWTLCGFICGIALLTRSNSITLLALLLLPWMAPLSAKERLNHFMMFIVGLCIPIILWICYAKITGGPLAPAGNHINIALTYFSHGTDRISGDARAPLEKEFAGGMWQVLSYDPVHIIKTYFSDLINNKALKAGQLLPFPVNFIGVACFVVMLFRKPANFFWYYLIFLTVLQILLVNFKAYEARYYLFLLPVIAAPSGMVIDAFYRGIGHKFFKYLLMAVIISGTIFLSVQALVKTYSNLHKNDEELKEAVNKISMIIKDDKDPIIFSRKEHLSYYLGVRHSVFPRVATIEELSKVLQSHDDGNVAYIYCGSAERSTRPLCRSLSENKYSSFKLAAQSKRENFWKLYEYLSKPKNK